jgi:hypothetical protein
MERLRMSGLWREQLAKTLLHSFSYVHRTVTRAGRMLCRSPPVLGTITLEADTHHFSPNADNLATPQPTEFRSILLCTCKHIGHQPYSSSWY